MTPLRRRLALVLRVAVSAAVIAWLLARLDVAAAFALLAGVRFPWLAAALVSVAATHGVNCWRWRLCLLDDGRRVSFRTLVFSYWTSLFVSLALPTEYGGDLLRIRDLWGRLESGATAAASVAWSRLAGFAATFLVLSLAGLGRLERLAELSLVGAWALSVAICAALLAGLWILPSSDLPARLLDRLPGGRLRDAALRLVARAQALASHREYGWRIAALALAAQASMIATNWLYARALSQPVAVLDMALVVPLVALASLVPVSLGGLGVKEGAFVVGLSAAGLPPEGALAVALLNRLVQLALALIGGCLFPFRHRLLVEQESAESR